MISWCFQLDYWVFLINVLGCPPSAECHVDNGVRICGTVSFVYHFHGTSSHVPSGSCLHNLCLPCLVDKSAASQKVSLCLVKSTSCNAFYIFLILENTYCGVKFSWFKKRICVIVECWFNFWRVIVLCAMSLSLVQGQCKFMDMSFAANTNVLPKIKSPKKCMISFQYLCAVFSLLMK